MDMESQKILFALSTPMEIRNECCLPSHSSPKMYLGTCFFLHIRDREFDPFAFRINDNALPEIVDDYVFQQPKQDRNFSLAELTERQHREALENGFGKQVVQGYSNVIAALKQGYASIGYERGRNVLVSLNKFLVNKRMIVKEGKGYRYNPDFHY